MATATVPLRARMAESYLLAAVFATEKWGQACVSVDNLAPDVRDHGLSAAYGRAVLRREFWQDESQRCELIAAALEAMA